MKNYWKEFAKYLVWAAIQHALVYGIVVLLMGHPYDPKTLLVYSCLFVALHIPNAKLMIATAILVSFNTVLLHHFQSQLIWFVSVPIHAGAGTYLKVTGVEMRVLWNYPKDKL